jgi:hypothetical protein
MEETDMCHLTPAVRTLQQAISNGCAAKALAPSQRASIGLQALAGTQSITGLADTFDVSRKFVYQQAATAQAALDDAFTPPATADDQPLFYLPVTKNWLRQAALGLTLICHSSYRGVVEFCRDLLDVDLSVGTVHNIVGAAIDKARPYNLNHDLSNVTIAGLDEIYQNRQPVLVGADIASTYCFLLSREDHCDADTWGIRLLEAKDRHLAPQATVADFGKGIRAGHKLAWPTIPCRGDVFHALQSLTAALAAVDHRAYQAMEARNDLERQQARHQRRHGRADLKVASRLPQARQAEAQAVAVAEDVAVLLRWLQNDILSVAGPTVADRRLLYGFVVSELWARAAAGPQCLTQACRLLDNNQEDLLAFAAQLDRDLERLAEEFQVPVAWVRDLLQVQSLGTRNTRRWQQEAVLREHLRGRFYALSEAVANVAHQTVRASSVIENLNSRLRNYFFLRRHLGDDYLALLQFFLNHRRFLRSEHPERVNKSPAELLAGVSHPHWLELLGYTRFQRQ